MVKTVEKPWGKFIEYATNEEVTVKIIHVKAGEILSLQSHEMRDETWVALDEGLIAYIDGKEEPLEKGKITEVPRRTKHRIRAEKDARFLEISRGTFDENDITRYEDKYGRA